MLLHTYCIGQLPKMRNGNGFWHHWRDLGMIIILAWSTAGSVSESFSLFCSLSLSRPLSLYLCVCVSATRNGNSRFLSGKCLLSLLSSSTLLLCSVFLLCLFVPASLLRSTLVFSLWLSEQGQCMTVDIQHGSKLGGCFCTLTHFSALHTHTHMEFCPRDKIPNQLCHKNKSHSNVYHILCWCVCLSLLCTVIARAKGGQTMIKKKKIKQWKGKIKHKSAARYVKRQRRQRVNRSVQIQRKKNDTLGQLGH